MSLDAVVTWELCKDCARSIYGGKAPNARYDAKVDEIKKALHELGLRVERAIKGAGLRDE